MADSKIDFTFENLHFSCEGDNAWVEKQLNHVLSRIPSLLAYHKKGENVVEEVIEINEVEEGNLKSSPATKVKRGKTKQGKVTGESVSPVTAKKKMKPDAGEHKPELKKRTKKEKLEKPVIGPVDSLLNQYLTEKRAQKNQVRKFLATAVYLARISGVSRMSTSAVTLALKEAGIEKLANASDCLNKNEKSSYCIKEGKEFVITENGFLHIE